MNSAPRSALEPIEHVKICSGPCLGIYFFGLASCNFLSDSLTLGLWTLGVPARRSCLWHLRPAPVGQLGATDSEFWVLNWALKFWLLMDKLTNQSPARPAAGLQIHRFRCTWPREETTLILCLGVGMLYLSYWCALDPLVQQVYAPCVFKTSLMAGAKVWAHIVSP